MSWVKTRIGGAMLAATLAIGSAAFAQAPVSPPATSELLAVMRLYADGVAGQQAAVAACEPGRVTGWDDGVNMLLASLAAAGIGPTDIGELRKRLDVPTDPVDCASQAVRQRIAALAPGTWSQGHEAALKSIGVRAVYAERQAARERQLAGIRTVLSGHQAAQQLMLTCLSVVDPRWLPSAWMDWDRMLGEIEHDMMSAGFSHAESRAATAPVRSASLVATAGDDRQALLESCSGKTWSERMYTLSWYSARKQVQDILPSLQR